LSHCKKRRKPEQHRRSTLASLSGSPIASPASGIAVSGCNGDKYKIFSVLDKSPGAAKGQEISEVNFDVFNSKKKKNYNEKHLPYVPYIG
jgi:hypothetical protein